MGELTYYCRRYYFLRQRLVKEKAYLQKFIDNIPVYKGEKQINKIDGIIKYYRKGQEVSAAIDKTIADLKKVEKNILAIMRHFDIRPYTFLECEIEDEAEIEIWAGHDEEVHMLKIKDLTVAENPNFIITRLTLTIDIETTIFDDEDEWFPK